MSMISQDGQPRKFTEFELMMQLKHRIYLLYLIATGSASNMSIQITTLDPLEQLSEI